MNPEIFALAVTTAVFAGGAVALILQRSLPEKYTSGGPRTSPYSRPVSHVFRAHRTGARLYEQEVMSRSWTRGGITRRARNYPFL
ncbi:MAG: hypothetical protein WAL59_25050 [Roseiarcus sp.]